MPVPGPTSSTMPNALARIGGIRSDDIRALGGADWGSLLLGVGGSLFLRACSRFAGFSFLAWWIVQCYLRIDLQVNLTQNRAKDSSRSLSVWNSGAST